MDERTLIAYSDSLKRATLKDVDLVGWLALALQQPGLPDMLAKLRRRMLDHMTQALRPGDTEEKKARFAELTYVIDFFENFNKYADTETETVND
jgi:hypothetical protein